MAGHRPVAASDSLEFLDAFARQAKTDISWETCRGYIVQVLEERESLDSTASALQAAIRAKKPLWLGQQNNDWQRLLERFPDTDEDLIEQESPAIEFPDADEDLTEQESPAIEFPVMTGTTTSKYNGEHTVAKRRSEHNTEANLRVTRVRLDPNPLNQNVPNEVCLGANEKYYHPLIQDEEKISHESQCSKSSGEHNRSKSINSTSTPVDVTSSRHYSSG